MARTAAPAPQNGKKEDRSGRTTVSEHVRRSARVRELRRRPSFVSQPVEVIAPLDKVDATVRRGDSVRVEGSCEHAKSGTSFPAAPLMHLTYGSSSKRSTTRVKQSFTAVKLETVAEVRSEPGGALLSQSSTDEHGNPINKRNAWMNAVVAYVRLVPRAPPTRFITVEHS